MGGMARALGEGQRVDPRTRRTVAALQEALAGLVVTAPLSEVTVAELCRAAGLHRTTFYKHFSNIAELAETTITELLEQIGPRRSGGVSGYDAWLTALLDHVAARRRTYAALLGPHGDPTLAATVIEQLIVRAGTALEPAARDGADLGLDTATAARVLGLGSYGLVASVLADEDLDSAATAEAFTASLPRSWPPLLMVA